jgi:hypothetical protein
MITDQQSLQAIRDSWAGVRELKKHAQLMRLVPGMGFIDFGGSTPDAFWNLPFALAYSVLDQALSALRDQSVFVCGTWMLGPKMEASKQHLPWQDYDLVSRGKDARNDLAHRAILLPKKECFLYVDAVGVELKAWGIVNG